MSEKSTKISQAIEEAQNITEAARKKAAEILLQAELSVNQIKDAAREEGLEIGKSEVALQALRLIEDTQILQEKFAEQAAELAVAIAEEILKKELSLNPILIQEFAIKALQESNSSSHVKIFVPSRYKEIMQENMHNLSHSFRGVEISVHSDDTLASDGCVVKTEFGEVEATISSMLESCKKVLGLRES